MKKTGVITINGDEIPTLLAVTQAEQEKGLMHQKFPPPVMSFIYEYPKINKFWMKNTPSPLDIVFCLNNKIINICKGKPFSTELIGDDNFSDLIIEFPYGTCESKKIKLGDSVNLKFDGDNDLKDSYAIFIKI
jgi:uncharacterized membrane protein (UPF0127 family)